MALKTGFEIPPEMRAFAEKSVGEARKAFESYMDAATKALGSVEQSAQTMQSTARELGRKAIGFAEDNVTATLDFAEKLVQAKDPEEFMRLQAEFTQAQMKSLSEQTKALGDSAAQAGKSAFEAMKPKA
ncbi:MAG TPA: phasin [Xanthobacteraceae bacterium]|nr:phasin [Xanthobacteraceae bacterium]